MQSRKRDPIEIAAGRPACESILAWGPSGFENCARHDREVQFRQLLTTGYATWREARETTAESRQRVSIRAVRDVKRFPCSIPVRPADELTDSYGCSCFERKCDQ